METTTLDFQPATTPATPEIIDAMIRDMGIGKLNGKGKNESPARVATREYLMQMAQRIEEEWTLADLQTAGFAFYEGYVYCLNQRS